MRVVQITLTVTIGQEPRRVSVRVEWVCGWVLDNSQRKIGKGREIEREREGGEGYCAIGCVYSSSGQTATPKEAIEQHKRKTVE